MRLIIVQGQTSTGKTTLARRLAADTGMAVVIKDSYKEAVFERQHNIFNLLRWTKIEKDSWQEIYRAVRCAQQNSQALIIEGNFLSAQQRELRKILRPTDTVSEVYCYADPKVVFRRYVIRNKTGERHKGHWDALWYATVWVEGICTRLGWRWVRPMRLSGRILSVDTTVFVTVDYTAILAFVQSES